MKKKKIKEILIGSLFFNFFYPSPSGNSCLTSTTEAWFWRDWMNLNLMMLETGKRLWTRMASQKMKELNYRFNFSQFLNEKLYLQASVRPGWKKRYLREKHFHESRPNVDYMLTCGIQTTENKTPHACFLC